MAKTVARPDRDGTHRLAFERNKKKIYATQTVCGICGKPVDFSYKFPHPLSPCIDHIIPVAKAATPATSPTCSWRILVQPAEERQAVYACGAADGAGCRCLHGPAAEHRLDGVPQPLRGPQRRRDTHAGTGGIPLPRGPLTFPDRTVNIFS